jgi:H+/Cl- antiporter ClcA
MQLSGDPAALLRSRQYRRLLILAAALGLPISALAYGYLALLHFMEEWVYRDLPHAFGLDGAPDWWAIPMLTLAGLLVGLAIRFLPGHAGHIPARGFSIRGGATTRELPGILIAAVAGLGLGAVLGPEGPLLALGGGLAVLALGRRVHTRPPEAIALVRSVGSFAALSTLLGSPIVGAFLMMEVIGIGGPMLGLVLVPGLLASGIGTLIFIGLGQWSGLGTLSLSVPDLPAAQTPTPAQFGWAIGIGLAGAFAGQGIQALGRAVDRAARPRPLLLTPIAGLAMGVLALVFVKTTGHPLDLVLFSGETALAPLLRQAGTFSAGALAMLVLCKGLAYAMALGAFRGGPIFPALLVGAAGGLAVAHLPGLPPIAGAAMGMGALVVSVLRLPLSSMLIPTLFLGSQGLELAPLVIVSVVVAYVASTRETNLQSRTAS